MATHSSFLTWRIPWTENPGGLTVHRVAQSWTRLKQLSMYTCACFYQGVIASRLSKLTGQEKAVAPTLVLLPGKSHGQRSLQSTKSQTQQKCLSTHACTLAIMGQNFLHLSAPLVKKLNFSLITRKNIRQNN